MNFKKAALLSTVFALLPLVAHADLVSQNQTNKYSTVVIFGKDCAGGLGKFTSPYSTLTLRDFEVRAICKLKNPCSATIIVSDSENDVRSCRGTAIGDATLDTASLKIIAINSTSSQYKISGLGTNTMILSE